MEKIYEEKSYSQNHFKMNFSIVLSFLVAAFAILSLIVAGFNQISYAEPATSEITLEFEYEDPDDSTTQLYIKAFGTYEAGKPKGNFKVPVMYTINATGEKEYLFCIQQGIDPETNYSTDKSFSDSGLVYIINQSSVMGGPGIAVPKADVNTGDNKYLEIYATQIAIWKYLDKKYEAGSPYHGQLDSKNYPGGTRDYSPRDIIDHADQLTLAGRAAGEVELWKETTNGNFNVEKGINDLISTAKGANGPKSIWLDYNADESISLVGDNDIYQTPKMSVASNASDLKEFDVILKGLDDAAYVVDVNGNKKSTFTKGSEFYIRVPVNKVTEDANTVTITLSGLFENYYGGEYFAAGAGQKILRITDIDYRVTNEDYVSFLTPPDTGMTTAQTIYFIGLIVLLCGVGIIYANAKPVEDK